MAVVVLRDPNAFLGMLAFRDLGFERACLLLQQRDSEETVVRVLQREIVLIGNDPAMLSANGDEVRASRLTGKAGHRIIAAERKGSGFVQLVPELFQADGGRIVPGLREERDHLPKQAYRTSAGRRTRDNASQSGVEECRIGHPISVDLC